MHTQGKWIVGVGCRIRDKHDNSIGLCAGDASHFDWKTNEANANRICLAVNLHDELVAALEMVERAIGKSLEQNQYDQVMQALNKAKGE